MLPFNKFSDVSIYLGPEMRSTGEVMGISYSFGNAFAKSQLAAGGELPTAGTVFISVNDNDKFRVIPIARDFVELGFDLVATEGTCRSLRACGIACSLVHKVGKGEPTSLDLIRQGKINLIVNTPWGKVSRTHEYEIGRVALAHNVPCITTLSGASAAVRGIMSGKTKCSSCAACRSTTEKRIDELTIDDWKQTVLFNRLIVNLLMPRRSLEGNAVIDEEVPVPGSVAVLPAVIADAVAGIQQTVSRKRDRDSRREISEPILSAEPVGHNADRFTGPAAHSRESRLLADPKSSPVLHRDPGLRTQCHRDRRENAGRSPRS